MVVCVLDHYDLPDFGRSLLVRSRFMSASPQSRQAILTALYRDTALYKDTALNRDTALLRQPLTRDTALYGDTALFGDRYCISY